MQAIPTIPPERRSMDYQALRAEGVQILERIASHAWTDFNAHDPGITILEQLCYAITELGYRIDHDLPDLLAGGDDPYQSLYGPRAILTSEPVTLLDLRKLVLDVEGVQNAWIEPVTRPSPKLVYDERTRDLRLLDPDSSDDGDRSTPVVLAGLYRVLIALSDVGGGAGASAVQEVKRKLHAHRPLCADFPDIRLLVPQDVEVHARVEIAPGQDPLAALVSIYETIGDHIAPSVRFSTLRERVLSGEPLDDIFAGPPLERGFIDQSALARLTRKTEIHTSDLLHEIMDIPGVRAVQDISLSSDLSSKGKLEPWTLELEEDHVPTFDCRRSNVTLLQRGVVVTVNRDAAADTYDKRRWDANKRTTLTQDEKDRTPPLGQDRHVGRYTSIQLQFPACYGIGETGLPGSAPPERQVRARQLKAYLLLFDQILANSFAQLDHVKKLLSFHGEDAPTYAAQPVDGERLGIDGIRRDDGEEHALRLRGITAKPEQSRSPNERTHRFLDHLLARFAEQLAPSSSTRDKRAFLQSYPRISSARGTGFDTIRPRGPENRSGLEERIQRALGLDPDQILLIEHILLRPIPEDYNKLSQNDVSPVPLLAGSPCRDPYSRKLSFVFPKGLGDRDFQRLVEQTVRAETPAHLTPYVHWLDSEAFGLFVKAYDEWAEKHQSYWTEKLGL